MFRGRILVAVDGPAGSGKSSVSKEVAKRLGLKYVDSGAIYRAITLYLLKKYNDIQSVRDYSNDINQLSIRQIFNVEGTSLTFLNGVDVSREIREEVVTKNIGIISDDLKIRNFVNSLLRKWVQRESIIMDGRDIGTVVFPHADVKVFIDASVEVRAKRRVMEYEEKGKTVDAEDIRKQIVQRDKEDIQRHFGGLKKADDAIYIDTSNMDKEEVVQEIIKLISCN